MWQAGPAADELCGCGQPFGECPFWQAVGQEAFGGWDKVDVDEVLALEADVLRHRNIPLLALAAARSPSTPARCDRYAELTAQRLRGDPDRLGRGGRRRLDQEPAVRLLPARAPRRRRCACCTSCATAAASSTRG